MQPVEVVTFFITVALFYIAYKKTGSKNILHIMYAYIGLCVALWSANLLGI
jgi:multisubunit Na+/H+ antiporter MnhB subunit